MSIKSYVFRILSALPVVRAKGFSDFPLFKEIGPYLLNTLYSDLQLTQRFELSLCSISYLRNISMHLHCNR
jgi:hypothetical protein